MRLIDADAIKLSKGFFENVNNVPRFYEWLDTLPTIDPVKHGKWLPHPTEPDWDVCSICGIGTHRRFHYNEGVYGGYDVEESFAYCPNCGAKMEGGKE